MQAYARPAPWNNYEAVNADQYTKGGNLKSSFSQGSMEWDLSSGWHFKRQEGWKKDVKRHKHTFKSPIDGKKYTVYRYDGDYDDAIGYHAGSPDYDKRIAYALDAFNKNKGNVGQICEAEGCGHIKYLRYAVREQILLVNFVNGDATCVFFRVPSAVAGILLHDAESKQTITKREIPAKSAWTSRTGIRHTTKISGRYVKRHALGIHFWDYIRIRGLNHGSKFPFEYVKHATGRIANDGTRHTLKVKLKDIYGILGDDNSVSRRLQAQLRPVLAEQGNNPEVEITTVLTEQELAQLNDEMANFLNARREAAEAQTGDSQVIGYGANLGNAVSDEDKWIEEAERSSNDAANMSSSASVHGALGTNEMAHALYDLFESSRSTVNDIIQAFQSSPTSQMILEDYYQAQMARGYQHKNKETGEWEISQEGKRRAMNEFMRNEAGLDLKNAYDFKRGAAKSNLNYDTAKALVRALNGKGFIKSWIQQNIPGKYKLQYTGRVWTPKQLKEFANAEVPGNISKSDVTAYKKFVQTQDWVGALNFLKTHKTDLLYYNPINGEQKLIKRQTYASSNDKLGTEE